jgi:hypothetical protein
MEFSDTALVLHAIAEASDESLDAPGAAADLEVSSGRDSRMVRRMPARVRMTVVTAGGPG